MDEWGDRGGDRTVNDVGDAIPFMADGISPSILLCESSLSR